MKNFTGLHTDYNLEKATCVRLSAALLIVIQLCMVGKPDSKVKMTNLTSPCQMLELLKAQGIKSYDTLLVQHLLSFRRQYKDFYSGNDLLLTAYSLGCEARQNVSARIYLISRNSFHVKVSVALLSDVKWRAVTVSGTAWST